MSPERWLYTIPLRMRSLFKRRDADNDLDEELQFHVDQKTQEFISKGFSEKDARYAARREFHGIQQSKENCRDARKVNWIQDFLQDLRYGTRMSRKNPGFTAVAILTLALGIAASTVVFSVIYNGLLRPFPYKEANRLLTFRIQDLRDINAEVSGPDSRGGLTSAELVNFREQTETFDDMIGAIEKGLFLTASQTTLHVQAAYVTPNTFQFLGVDPLLGRGIIPEDAKPEAPPVFAMNYKLWQKYFNADPRIVGTSFVIAGISRTLVAVMPLRFQFNSDDIWIPTTPRQADTALSTSAAEPTYLWWPIGRLKIGQNAQAASADLNVISHRFAKTFPDRFPAQFTVVAQPFVDVVVGNFKNTLYALAAAVAMLLLITCTNVANLLLARGTTRQKEIAIRASLGASRGRLIRQFLVESLTLATAGAVVGWLFAYWGLKAILTVLPDGTLPDEAVFELNSAVLIFSSIVTVLIALLCGLVVALYGLRGELNARLAGAGKGSGVNTRVGNFRGGLVIAEIALSTVLLIAAGLMMRTLFALTHVELGFSPSNILVTGLTFPKGAFPVPGEKRAFLQQALQRIESTPGVIAATSTISLPPFGGPGSELEIPGQPDSRGPRVAMDLCSEGFFPTLGIHLLRGRLMAESDMVATSRVVVVNDALARRFFGQGDAVGRKIKFKVLDLIPDAPHNAYFEIVGVVSGIKNQGLRNPVQPQAYLPVTAFDTGDGNILVRTAVNPLSLARQVHDAISSASHSVSLTDTTTLESDLQRFSYAAPEFGLVTFGTFAGIGLLLVNVGIFGLMAYTVSTRTHEIGIRMALGAQPNNILRMILAKGLRLVAAGIVLGLAASYGLTRFLASQIWSITTTDHGTFAAVAILAACTGLAACYIPARRATRVDPMVALRNE